MTALSMKLLPAVLLTTNLIFVQTNNEPIKAGKFESTWESLQQYRCPDWFRDAKFGIWAHWGAQPT